MLITKNFKCEDLGIIENYVYDIEVEDNHNFFANNICVHNSVYINLNKLVEKMFPGDQTDIHKIVNFLDRFINEKIEKAIEQSLENFKQTLNHKQNLISFKREAIADKAVFKSKKRYFMNVWDNEGVRYSTPELKIMGIEIVRSSTPRFCKNKLKEALKIIIDKDNSDLKKFIRQCKREFKQSPLVDIAFPRGVSDVEKFVTKDNIGYIKGTPMHVKASLAYNNMLKECKIKHLPKISNGSKIKYIYIREPNHIRSNVIGFSGDDIPLEFDLHKYIDYNTQFNKAFIEPLKAITDIIGWDINVNGLAFTKEESNV